MFRIFSSKITIMLMVALVIIVPAFAQETSMTITYQGYLDDNGAPANGAFDMTFTIYDTQTLGTALWTETHTNVTVTDGLFTVALGSNSAFDPTMFQDNTSLYLEVVVGATILTPRQPLTASPYSVHAVSAGSLTALRIEPNATSPNIIGGHSGNAITAGVAGATISGGGDGSGFNRVTDNFGTVGGGENNQAGDADAILDSARHATVGGGEGNQATHNFSTVAGGTNNTASGSFSTVAGGGSNQASGSRSAVGGGTSNQAGAGYATVGGGQGNRVIANFGTIAGGGPSDLQNPVTTSNYVTDTYGTIGGGANNQAGDDAGATDDASFATVSGGRFNVANDFYATVGGGDNNMAGGVSTIGGGSNNIVSGVGSTVGGGRNNDVSGGNSTVGGGWYNDISGHNSTIGGGANNNISANYGTIAGGAASDFDFPDTTNNQVTDDYGTIGGGGNNRAGNADATLTNASFSTVGGGLGNTASGNFSSVGGGGSNTASGVSATVSGGGANTASGVSATVSGGNGNTAAGIGATVVGGSNNVALGDYSFVLGQQAKNVNDAHDGVFLFADLVDADFGSTAANEFAARATGGVRFVTAVDLNGDPTTTCGVPGGESTWACTSSREAKNGFDAVDTRAVLEAVAQMPVTTWRYNNTETLHMGPVAEDFYAAFGLGEGDTTISTVDADGVSLAAIQGLYEMMQEKDARIAALESQDVQLSTLQSDLRQMQMLLAGMFALIVVMGMLLLRREATAQEA